MLYLGNRKKLRTMETEDFSVCPEKHWDSSRYTSRRRLDEMDLNL